MPTQPKQDVPSLREAAHQFVRLVRLIRPYWRQILQGMLLALVLGLLGMVTPYLTKLLIDEVYPTENVTLMYVLVGGLLAVGLGSALLGALRNYFTLYVNTRLNSATRLLFFNHLQHLEARFFDQHQVGEVNSRFQDVGQALQSISKIFQIVFVQGVYLLLVPPILFFLEWRLAGLQLLRNSKNPQIHCSRAPRFSENTQLHAYKVSENQETSQMPCYKTFLRSPKTLTHCYRAF